MAYFSKNNFHAFPLIIIPHQKPIPVHLAYDSKEMTVTHSRTKELPLDLPSLDEISSFLDQYVPNTPSHEHGPNTTTHSYEHGPNTTTPSYEDVPNTTTPSYEDVPNITTHSNEATYFSTLCIDLTQLMSTCCILPCLPFIALYSRSIHSTHAYEQIPNSESATNNSTDELGSPRSHLSSDDSNQSTQPIIPPIQPPRLVNTLPLHLSSPPSNEHVSIQPTPTTTFQLPRHP